MLLFVVYDGWISEIRKADAVRYFYFAYISYSNYITLYIGRRWWNNNSFRLIGRRSKKWLKG